VDIDRLFTEAKTAFGRIDIVIANSGIAGGFIPLGNVTNEAYERLINTNLTGIVWSLITYLPPVFFIIMLMYIGVFYTLRAAANNIEANGRIVVIGSGLRSGLTPGAGVSNQLFCLLS
jgi:3-oxoacyl-[acyl-carrier protein] reductase